MTAAELLDVAEVERLALGPGDMVVIKCPMYLNDDEFEEMGNRFKAAFPDGTKFVILEGGVDIAVIKADQVSEQP
jgi:hypothetical protein